MISNLHGSENFNVLPQPLCSAQHVEFRECMIVFTWILSTYFWNSHFEFNDLYKFNLCLLVYVFVNILNLGIVDYKFWAQLNFGNETISFFLFFDFRYIFELNCVHNIVLSTSVDTKCNVNLFCNAPVDIKQILLFV